MLYNPFNNIYGVIKLYCNPNDYLLELCILFNKKNSIHFFLNI